MPTKKKKISHKRMYLVFWVFVSVVFIIGFLSGIIVYSCCLNDATITVKADTTLRETVVSLGECKLTAYCAERYPHICNDGDASKTSTGVTPTVGRTVAVDPNIIPYGSKVIINGHTYIAEDCDGGIRGNRVDILFATHQEALEFGVQYAEVAYVKE